MKTLSLSVVLAAAFGSSAVHASETESSAPGASVHVIPALYTPSTITPSGREFIARCNDEAFARTRFPRGLANQCERLLGLWHGEASHRWDSTAGASLPIPDYGNALRISHMFAPAPTPRPSPPPRPVSL
jgi:hypothetical protein